MSHADGHAPAAGAGAGTVLPPDAPPPPNVKPTRLMLVLVAFGAACGLALALAFEWTQPRIEAHQDQITQAAVHEVLKGPDHFKALYVVNGALTERKPDVDPAKLERVYLGYDEAGQPIGFAVVASGPGFQDNVKLIFGYNPRTEQLSGMKLIDQRETPGIGDRVEKDLEFVAEFVGPRAPLEAVKPGRGKDNPHAVDTITGATISSRAVITMINKRIAAVGPLLEAYLQQGGAR